MRPGCRFCCRFAAFVTRHILKPALAPQPIEIAGRRLAGFRGLQIGKRGRISGLFAARKMH